MFDAHYDLLSIYIIAKYHHKLDRLEEYYSHFHYDNINGVFANLYFMSKKEMEDELGCFFDEIDVISLFKEAKEVIDKAKIKAKILYSIEGCDYIKDEKELIKLYKLGLDAIVLVWNNKNKYGSGIRTNEGLSEDGRKFIETAINLGMGIDLSHANEKTFWDIVNIIKIEQEKGKKVHCYASHSNSYELTNHKRNLTKEQLESLANIGGFIGVVSYPLFVGGKTKAKYLEHINYMVKIFGIDKVMLASDDMSFLKLCNEDAASKKSGIYEHSFIAKEIKNDLKEYYSKQDIEKIMVKNANKLYNNIKGERNYVRY